MGLFLKYRGLKYSYVHWHQQRGNEGLDQDASSSGPMPEQRRAVSWTDLFPKQWAKRESACGCTQSHFQTSLLLSVSVPPQLPWPVADVSLCLGRRKQKWGSYTLPNWATPRFAGSFGHIICEVGFFFVFRVTFDSDSDVVLYGAALYLCFSRTVPLYPLRFFLVFVSFLNYRVLCVCEIKAFINLLLVWLLFLKRAHILQTL